MTDWDRTASQIRRAEEARRRIRIRTEPVLPVITQAPPGNGAASPPEHAVVFDIRDVSIYYGESRALAGTSLKIYRNGDRGDRSVRVRQVHVHPQPQPDE